MNFLLYIYCCVKAYRNARRRKLSCSYFALTSNGVPHTAVYMALGREAWRISHIAVETFPQGE